LASYANFSKMRIPEFDIPTLARKLARLADISFEPVTFESAAHSLGWDVHSNEYALDQEVVLEVRIPNVLPVLLAVFSDNSIAGLPLYVLTDDTSIESPYYRHTTEDFNETFRQLLDETESVLGKPAITGDYLSKYVSGIFGYALWPGRHCFFVLVQHDEGDANFGHGPTMDYRLLPKNADGKLPKFPLETNLIF
jgi:hypothetical protein